MMFIPSAGQHETADSPEATASTTRPEHNAAGPDPATPVDNTDQTLYDSLPALVPVRDAAKILGLPPSSLYRYAKNEVIPCERLGSRVYILKIGIRRWLNAHQETQP